jgi:hypothetical protein
MDIQFYAILKLTLDKKYCGLKKGQGSACAEMYFL